MLLTKSVQVATEKKSKIHRLHRAIHVYFSWYKKTDTKTIYFFVHILVIKT